MNVSPGRTLAVAAALLAVLGMGGWFVAGAGSDTVATKARARPDPHAAHELARAQPVRSKAPGRQRAPSATRAESLTHRLLALWHGAPGDEDEAHRIAAELLTLGEAAGPPLLAVLDREPRGSARDRLFDLLRQVPGRAAESGLIAEALTTDAGVSRAIAIEALGERGTEAALDALNQIARRDPQVLARPFITTTLPDSNDLSTELPDEVAFTPRMKAMAALAASGDARAIPLLAGVLREEPDPALRMEAASALARLHNDVSTVEALTEAALTDRSPYVRLAALHSLSGVLDPGLLEPLGRISTADAHPGVRLLAGRVLARLREDLASAALGG